MIAVAPLAAAGALLCWPASPVRARLRAITGGRRPRHWSGRQPGPAVLIGLPTLITFGLAGPVVAIAVAVVGATVRGQYRVRQRTRRQFRTAETMADALGGLVLELRAGAHPVAAAEATARDVGEPAAEVLRAIAATNRLGGDIAGLPDRFAPHGPALGRVLRPLVHAWTLAQQHGVPLADVLDAVHRDLAARLRFAHKVRARMAGPRASSAVLAVLPVFGVLLGQSMGAAPIRVLLVNPVGQVMLALGATLAGAGLWWIGKLTAKPAVLT
jgi:tight adherence protein B